MSMPATRLIFVCEVAADAGNLPEQGLVGTTIVTVVLLAAVVLVEAANRRQHPDQKRSQSLSVIQIRVLTHHCWTNRMQDHLRCSLLGRTRTPPSDLPQHLLTCHLRVRDHRNQVATRIARPT